MASLDLYAPHIYVPPAVKWYVRTSELGTGSDTKFGKFAEERLIRDIKMVLLHIDYSCRTDNLYGLLCLDYPNHPQMIVVNMCPHIVSWIIHVSCGCTSYQLTP